MIQDVYENHLNKILPDGPNKNYIKNLIVTKTEQISRELFAKIRDAALMDSRQSCPAFRASVHLGFRFPVEIVKCILENLDSKKLLSLHIEEYDYKIKSPFDSNWFTNDTKWLNVNNISFSWAHDNRCLLPVTETSDETKAAHMKPFWEAAQKGDGTDIIFKVKDKQFHAHRSFIQHHSPVIKALLTKMKEAGEQEIEMQEDDPQWFGCLLYYIYNCDLPPGTNLSHANCEQIFTIADKYDVKSLRILAKENLLNSLLTTDVSKENFSEIFHLAAKLGSEVILERCLNFVRMHPQGISLLLAQIRTDNAIHEDELCLVLKITLQKVLT